MANNVAYRLRVAQWFRSCREGSVARLPTHLPVFNFNTKSSCVLVLCLGFQQSHSEKSACPRGPEHGSKSAVYNGTDCSAKIAPVQIQVRTFESTCNMLQTVTCMHEFTQQNAHIIRGS